MALQVLLLEDERSVRRAFQLLLEEAGHEVHAASTVEEALEMLEDNALEVAIIDIVMARDGGRRLLQSLHTHRPDVGVIAITGDPLVFLELESARDLDVRLVKPVTREELLRSVDEALRKRLLRSQTRIRRSDVMDRKTG